MIEVAGAKLGEEGRVVQLEGVEGGEAVPVLDLGALNREATFALDSVMRSSPENVARIMGTAILGSVGLFMDSGETAEQFGFLGSAIGAALFFGVSGLLVAGVVRLVGRSSFNAEARSMFSDAWRYALILSAVFALSVVVQRYI